MAQLAAQDSASKPPKHSKQAGVMLRPPQKVAGMTAMGHSTEWSVSATCSHSECPTL